MSLSAKSKRDGRQTKRAKVLRNVTISPKKAGGEKFPCILKDLSETGCQVVGSNTELVAGTFYLRSSEFEGERECRVVWRSKRMIGAIFS